MHRRTARSSPQQTLGRAHVPYSSSEDYRTERIVNEESTKGGGHLNLCCLGCVTAAAVANARSTTGIIDVFSYAMTNVERKV